LLGKRKVPIYGEKDTHTENYVIAEVTRTPSRIDIRQKTLPLRLSPYQGRATEHEARNDRPPTHLPHRARRKAGRLARSGTLDHGLGREDIDGDGFPGATISISGRAAQAMSTFPTNP
jgi:hypothetical protein